MAGRAVFFLTVRPPPASTLFPYTTLFRSAVRNGPRRWRTRSRRGSGTRRSEEHTSELQSRENLVCRLLLEKKQQTSLTRTDSHKKIITTRLRTTQKQP